MTEFSKFPEVKAIKVIYLYRKTVKWKTGKK